MIDKNKGEYNAQWVDASCMELANLKIILNEKSKPMHWTSLRDIYYDHRNEDYILYTEKIGHQHYRHIVHGIKTDRGKMFPVLEPVYIEFQKAKK
jgi:hypothetical protein